MDNDFEKTYFNKSNVLIGCGTVISAGALCFLEGIKK